MNQTMDDLGDVEPITMCMHKPLLSPIDYSDAFILALAVREAFTPQTQMTPSPNPSFIHPIPFPWLTPKKKDILRYSPPPRAAQHPVSDNRMPLTCFASCGAQFVTIFLAAPTGTGGGGILVPAFILVGQFSPHSAVPLSKACILGGALINNIFNIRNFPTPLLRSPRRPLPKALKMFSI
jgi:hypothetical protein